MANRLIALHHRALIQFRGPDTNAFLQGLLTNDINKLQQTSGIGAFVLNTKGRIVEDVLLWRRGGDEIFLECSAKNRTKLVEVFAKYKLRKQVDVTLCDEKIGFLAGHAKDDKQGFQDPRFASFGSRVFGRKADSSDADVSEYNKLRFSVGIAEGAEELEDLLPFQANGDLLNMVSLDKGCYIGQELTARTAHTGVIRRRVLPFQCEKQLKPGSDIVDEKGNKVGKVIASDPTNALALLSLAAFKSTSLKVGDVVVRPSKPAWMPEKILDHHQNRTSLSEPPISTKS